MARNIRNSLLDSREARTKLLVRREPHWVKLAKGRHLGYRKLSTGMGTWIAKHRSSETGERRYQSLGNADDAMDADGLEILSYEQAQRLAHAFFAKAARLAAGEDPTHHGGAVRVSDAIAGYLADREAKGSKAVAADRQTMDALVLPVLGSALVEQLTHRRLKEWFHGLAKAPARVRTAKGAKPNTKAAPSTDDEKRARRATANRVWATLRAALNHAAREHKLDDAAWKAIAPFPETSAARVRFLSDDESVRLVNACAPDLRELVRGALYSGCRYGELCRLKVGDFNPDTKTLFVKVSKSGKARHVALGDEGAAFFARLGRPAGALLFVKANGEGWKKSDQQRPLEEACTAARIERATFHELRHTYASRLVRRGVKLLVVAAQLGHSSTAMCERHYAHLAPDFVSDSVREALAGHGLTEPDNVRSLKISG